MTFPRTPRTAALLAIAAAAGCNSLETTTAARLAPEPRGTLVAATTQPAGDVAVGTETPIRNWNRTLAEYQNGDTVSDSTGVRYISDVGQLIGRGGRTTRSDVVSSSGGVGASGTTPIGGALAGTTAGTGGGTASVATAGTGTAGGGTTVGGPASAGLSSGTGQTGAAQSGTVAGNVASGTGVGATGTGGATPAVASGSTVNGNVVRGDGSIVPVGSPGAAGTTGSTAVAPGSVGATVASPDVSAVDGNAVDASRASSTVSTTSDSELSTGETVAVGAALPFVETGVFFANVVTSPVTFWQQRHGIVSGGLEFPQTYTAMPALPPERARRVPKAAPPSVAAAKVPLVDTGTYPTTNPAAADVSTILPSTQPATPLKVGPSSMAPAKPAAAVVAAPLAAGRKPGTLKRAADVSPTAFVVTGAAPYAGRYETESNLTVADALSGAGVLPADASSVLVTVQRRGGSPATKVPLATLRTQNDAVKAGDVITVSSAR